MRSESPFRTKSLRLLGLGILVAVIDCLLLVSALRERHFAGIVLALLASLAAVGLVWLLWRETRAGLVQRATSESRESQKTTPGAEVSSPSLTTAEGPVPGLANTPSVPTEPEGFVAVRTAQAGSPASTSVPSREQPEAYADQPSLGAEKALPTIQPGIPPLTADPLDNRPWVKLVEEVVELFDEIESIHPRLHPPAQELAKHLKDRLVEILERNQVEILHKGEIGVRFNRARHQPAMPPADPEVAVVAEVLSPGFVVGRRVLRRAHVRLASAGDLEAPVKSQSSLAPPSQPGTRFSQSTSAASGGGALEGQPVPPLDRGGEPLSPNPERSRFDEREPNPQ
jgi:hypothetical protein